MKQVMELCLSCMVALEEAGYELDRCSPGMVICAECGTRCWGYAYRVEKKKKTEDEEET